MVSVSYDLSGKRPRSLEVMSLSIGRDPEIKEVFSRYEEEKEGETKSRVLGMPGFGPVRASIRCTG